MAWVHISLREIFQKLSAKWLTSFSREAPVSDSKTLQLNAPLEFKLSFDAMMKRTFGQQREISDRTRRRRRKTSRIGLDLFGASIEVSGREISHQSLGCKQPFYLTPTLQSPLQLTNNSFLSNNNKWFLDSPQQPVSLLHLLNFVLFVVLNCH